MKINIPLKLTLTRLIISPTILPLLLVYLLPYNYLWLNVVLALFFIALSLTDFLDGYLARKYNQHSMLGALLDPIADKFLLYATLIALVVVHKIFFVWVMLLIGREFFLMGLRQIAVEHGFSIKVSALGKLKTVVLSIALAIIIVNPYQERGLGLAKYQLINTIELLFLGAAVWLSLLSAYRYYNVFMVQFNAEQAVHKNNRMMKKD